MDHKKHPALDAIQGKENQKPEDVIKTILETEKKRRRSELREQTSYGLGIIAFIILFMALWFLFTRFMGI